MCVEEKNSINLSHPNSIREVFLSLPQIPPFFTLQYILNFILSTLKFIMKCYNGGEKSVEVSAL